MSTVAVGVGVGMTVVGESTLVGVAANTVDVVEDVLVMSNIEFHMSCSKDIRDCHCCIRKKKNIIQRSPNKSLNGMHAKYSQTGLPLQQMLWDIRLLPPRCRREPYISHSRSQN